MKKDYMARLEQAARWRLPPEEAEDVIADYRDIVGSPPRSEEELRREVGDPEQVVRLLVQPPKAYYAWLAVFAALAACLLAAALAPLPASPSYMLLKWYEWGGSYHLVDAPVNILTVLPLLQLAAGTGLCLACFLRRRNRVKGAIPKGVVLCGLLMLAALAYAWWTVWRLCADPEQLLTLWTVDESFIGEGIGPAYSAHSSPGLIAIADRLEWGCCALAGLVGLFALVKARTRDRRWAAVYILSLAAAVLSLAVFGMIFSFSDFGTPHNPLYDGWFRPYLPQFAVLTAVGLAGAGAALC